MVIAQTGSLGPPSNALHSLPSRLRAGAGLDGMAPWKAATQQVFGSSRGGALNLDDIDHIWDRLQLRQDVIERSSGDNLASAMRASSLSGAMVTEEAPVPVRRRLAVDGECGATA